MEHYKTYPHKARQQEYDITVVLDDDGTRYLAWVLKSNQKVSREPTSVIEKETVEAARLQDGTDLIKLMVDQVRNDIDRNVFGQFD